MDQTDDLVLVSLARRAAVEGVGRQIREANLLGLRETARMLAVAPATLRGWEGGVNRPTGERARRYGELLCALVEVKRDPA